ncbi:MAG TPA: acyl-ACP--UDP-N-acetylglucosamine O-acyltransferase [Candidatus Acidoferrales bacterium]|nr:acyl-ACP--UDP-N-acetylglucosamine O-acyltransferase [Candidatus Acidoferrales bacterium]
MTKIHPTAIVDPRAELDDTVQVGAYSVIGPKVQIGKATRVRTHVVIQGNTTIGCDNQIFDFATIGNMPQDLKYKGEESQLIIGDHNIVREYASLNPGTRGGGMVTRVGDHNCLMMYCHIAHDCIIGAHNIIANGATLGGHVVIEDHVVVGGLVGIHQFVKIGTGAIVGAGSMVSKDVVPYCNATGDRARVRGLNLVGLKRRGFSREKINVLKKAYRIIFQSGLKTKEAVERLRAEFPDSPEVAAMVTFIENSRRGICR